MKAIILMFPILVIADNFINPVEVMRFDKSRSQYMINNIRNKITNNFNSQYSAIAFIPSEVIYEPYGNILEMHLTVMLAAQDLSIPCVNAYTGYLPNAYLEFFNNADERSLNFWVKNNNIGDSKIQMIQNLEPQPIKVQKVNIKAFNNKYLCAEDNIVIANRDNPHRWETFQLIILKDNKCAIRAYDNRFISAELNEANLIKFIKYEYGPWENFQIIYLENNNVAFKAINGKFLHAEDSGIIRAIGETIGERETFLLTELEE